MRIQRSAAAAAVFAAVLLAGACSSSTKSTDAGAPAPSTPAAAPVTVTVTSAPATSSGSGAGGSSSSAAPSTAGSSSAQGGAASTACKGADLKVRIVHGTDADPDPAKSNEAATVAITNSGQSTCTVQGHPQVDLISASGDDWPLVPQAGDTPKLTLPPGTSAFASLYVLSHTAGGGSQAFQVKSAVITPPDTKTPTTVPWPWTWALERQDTATHPGTYIGAVNSTGT